MMTKNNEKFDINELLESLEDIRSNKYPHISKKLLEDIVNIELSDQDERSSAMKDVRERLDDYLKEVK